MLLSQDYHQPSHIFIVDECMKIVPIYIKQKGMSTICRTKHTSLYITKHTSYFLVLFLTNPVDLESSTSQLTLHLLLQVIREAGGV